MWISWDLYNLYTGKQRQARQVETWTGKRADRQDRQRCGHANVQTGRKADMQISKRVDRQAGRQTGRQADRQTCRQAGRQIGGLYGPGQF